VPFLTRTAHIWASGVICFSAGFWTSLPETDRDVFADAAQEAGLAFDGMIVSEEQRAMDEAQAAGATVIEPEDRLAWVVGARKVWTTLAPIVGGADRISAIRAQAA
jgi:TRAP-type transport system periplasmic protein